MKPENIYAAKLHRPVPSGIQMQFVDVGLMPALERNAGEALNRLVTQAIHSLMIELDGKVRSRADHEGVYKSVFWLLAAKLLKEKAVKGFKSLDLNDIRSVFAVVGEHYKDARDYPPGDRTWRPALARVASSIAGWGRLGNISAESLAFLYETALIDGPKQRGRKGTKIGQSDVRKTLGIHSTPSILVDHMLAQVWPLVDKDKLKDQRVFEPACGHGAFLTAALRDIRSYSDMEDSAERHRYLRNRIRGIEFDAFAVEVAKLSLTLADVPHGNTWHIEAGDMFAPGVLRDATEWATIVLSNPPYEDFKKTGANRWLKSDEPVTAQTKAVEMLKRAIPNLSPGAVFGFVLPQGTLYDREAKQLRMDLLASCEVAEISLFEDKLFSEADHEACILIGRRKDDEARVSKVMYRRVRNHDMEDFKAALYFTREERLEPSELGRDEDAILYVPNLREVWKYLDVVPRLGEVFDVQQGFQLKSKDLLGSRTVISPVPRAGFTKAILNASDEYTVWELPRAVWVDLRRSNVRRPGAASVLGTPQVVLNYARMSRDSWRLIAVKDLEGLAVSSRFLAFRAKHVDFSLSVLWAVLNSPIANAYSYCWTSKRETLGLTWLNMPLPIPTKDQACIIEACAETYLKLAKHTNEFMVVVPNENAVRRALLNLDAAVLRLYGLPPEAERQMLDIFDDVKRPGVGCMFRGYPPGWSSRPAVPSTELPDDDRPIWERMAELAAALPEEAIADLPTDGASQLDHYLYGAPKRTP
ncbi:MAG: SAM-dependent methyltransferase [Planctomycetota bacterium]|nr:SAM-dependent methyltransferase [Planctomycetota bacterium]